MMLLNSSVSLAGTVELFRCFGTPQQHVSPVPKRAILFHVSYVRDALTEPVSDGIVGATNLGR
jgi:hypothetical protein